VSSLVDKSLLREEEDPDGEPRYLLLETVREFGLERLAASGEEDAVRGAHAAWVLAFAERAEPILDGYEPAPVSRDVWYGRLGAEHGNVRAALVWFEQRGAVEAVLRLAGALADYWYLSGRWSEGRGWLERALAAGETAPAAARARGLVAAGFLAQCQGDQARAVPWLEEGLAQFRALGDVRREAHAALALGVAVVERGDYAQARADVAAALAAWRALGNRHGVAWSLIQLGRIAFGEGDLAAAAALDEEAHTLARELGNLFAQRKAARNLAHVAFARGEHDRAAAWWREVLAPGRLAWSEVLPEVAAGVATLAAAGGKAEQAARLLGATEALQAEVGMVLTLPERAIYARAAEEVKDRLGADAFAAALAAGRALPPEEALAEAAAVLADVAAGPAPAVSAAGSPPASAVPHGLTPREREVLCLLAAGRTYPQIAEALFLSPATIRTHVQHVYAKLAVASRHEAAAYVREHELC
jgi:non-specific serine/threonine protein kinase